MASSTKITYPDPSKTRVVKQNWGKSLAIPFGDVGIHGIIINNYNSAYIVWVAGSMGSLTLNKSLMYGSDSLNISYSNSTNILSTSSKDGTNTTITYIGS